MSRLRDASTYRSYADLAKFQRLGVDYKIEVQTRERSCVAVIAPHGGRIERQTSEIARQIAGDDFNLYLFEGIRQKDNYRCLHLTSHRFDEPNCVNLISSASIVLAIHGCEGKERQVLLGGLDTAVRLRLTQALEKAGVTALNDGHDFPALNPQNICNRGRTRRGVQLELTSAMRGSAWEGEVVEAVRSVLVLLDRPRNAGAVQLRGGK